MITLAVFAIAAPAHATVEINLEKTLKSDGVPLDVVVSIDGSRTFVLTDSGNILIYDHNFNLTDTINIGRHIGQIELDPSGERLLATNRVNKSVEILTLDFIQQINTQGSPVKGPPDAPVTIVVFSDFQ